jgi:hypothetical protein
MIGTAVDFVPAGIGRFVEYEREDLEFIARKIDEADAAGEPRVKHLHLQEVKNMISAKYGLDTHDISDESLLELRQYDLVYIQEALAESVTETQDPNTVYYTTDEVKDMIREKFGYDAI